MKQKEGENDSDWESVEEDAPQIKLEDLLDNLKIKDEDEEDDEQD